jgi:two-component system cell cycle sensor histidine kinase/response regulator CckA
MNRTARALPDDLTERLFARDGPYAPAVDRLRRELEARAQARAELASAARVIAIEGRTAAGLYVLTLRDITEQRARENELRSLQRVETAGHFALGLAHDMNNLLTPILCLTEHLESDLPQGSARAMVHDIRSAAERAAGLTRQTLRLVRREPAHVAPVELNSVVSEMTPLFERVAGHSVRVEVALAPDAGCVRLDRERLEHMLLNLVANARDAMPGGGRLTFGTALVPLGGAGTDPTIEPGEAYACLRIADTGIGMTRAVRERIFERFFTTKAIGRGTGLGLDAVRRFVAESQGCIGVHTAPGCGTTVTLYFPLVPPEVTSGETAATTAQEESSQQGQEDQEEKIGGA